MEYDYVIVGAGSAGCVLAARLSERPDVSVLLLEAGGAGGGLWESLPLGVGKILNLEDRIWRDMTLPTDGTSRRSVSWVSGRGLGGSSAVNGMLFVRGHPAMYDRMAQAGCSGWSYDDCLPYFRKLEDCRFNTSPNRAAGGPIGVSRAEPDPISEAFVDSCVDAGYPRVDDYNDQHPDGVSYLQLSVRKGWRSSAAVAYLRPNLGRGNLTIVTEAAVRKVLFHGRVATGVSYARAGRELQARARREVIVCAGAVRTPALLERSGIGSRQLLDSLGIEVVADRAQVGENLQDHFMPRVCFETREKGTVNHLLNSRLMQVREAIKFAVARKGLFADSALKATGYVRSDSAQPLPNLRLQVGVVSSESRVPALDAGRGRTRAARAGLDARSSFQIGVYDMYPRARGSTHIRSADPLQSSLVHPNYLGSEVDRRTLVAGLRIAHSLARSAPLSRVITREIRPGHANPRDDDLLNYAMATAETCWHPVGTCRMGSDSAAVVDPDCRVNEVERLRVVDGSVFPFITASNTNIPVVMLAEKMAERIAGAAR